MSNVPNFMHQALHTVQSFEDKLDTIARTDSDKATRRFYRAAANALGRVRRAQAAKTAPEMAEDQGGES